MSLQEQELSLAHAQLHTVQDQLDGQRKLNRDMALVLGNTRGLREAGGRLQPEEGAPHAGCDPHLAQLLGSLDGRPSEVSGCSLGQLYR